MHKKIIILTAAIFLIALAGVWFNRVRLQDWARGVWREPLPAAVTVDKARELQIEKRKTESGKSAEETQISNRKSQIGQSQTTDLSGEARPQEAILPPAESIKIEAAELPAEINLAVPFTPQAPYANWNQPYEDACEEAAALMVHYFYARKTFTPETADRELQDVFAFEDGFFGFNKDTDAAQTAEFIRRHFGYKTVDVRYDITADDIRRELGSGFPVIVPAYGRALGNPYFRSPGPTYHMLVVKGYTKGKFITNDPGTRRGADFVYDEAVLMNAVHDWNKGDVLSGRRAMIVIRPD